MDDTTRTDVESILNPPQSDAQHGCQCAEVIREIRLLLRDLGVASRAAETGPAGGAASPDGASEVSVSSEATASGSPTISLED